MPTKMRAKEDDAHQIITNHDPLPAHESPQTAKSVLDALEKNCRKRINNEELTLDRNKRICATSAQPEVVDSPSPREFVTIVQQSAKRGREQVSPLKKFNDSPYSQMRKRIKTKNNALLSSLSSSHYVLKPLHQAPQHPIAKISILATSTVTQNEKPLDEIDRQEKQMKEVSISSDKIPSVIESQPKPQLEKRLHLFNARADPTKRRILVDDDDEPKINFVKPREKSNYSDVDAIRQVEKQKLSAMLSGLSDGFKSPSNEHIKDSVDAPGSVSISFTTVTTSSTVAPIATPISSSSSIPSNTLGSLLASTVPGAPALSVSTTVPSFSIVPSVVTTSSILSNTTTIPSASTAAPTTLAITLGASDPSKTLVNIPFGSSAITSAEQTKATISMPSLLTPSTKSSTDPNKSLMTFTPVAKAPPVAPTGTTTSAGGFGLIQSKDATPIGFSFGSNTNSNGFLTTHSSNPVPAIANAQTTSSPSLSFNNSIAASALPSFSFGTKPVEATTTTAAHNFTLGTGVSTVAPISGISGNLGSTVSFIQKPQTTTASGVGFSFNTAQPSNSSVSEKSSNSAFSFGGAAAVPVTTSTLNFGSNNSAFGQPAVTTSGPSNSAFGQPAATSTGFSAFNQKPQETQQPAGMFAFGQTQAAPVTTNSAAPSAFSFGGSNQASVVTQQSGFSFGQANNIQSTPVAPKATSSIFSRLGEAQPETKAAFSFGGNTQPQHSISSPFGASNNAISSISSPMFGASNNSTFNKPTDSVFGSGTTNPVSNDFGTAAKTFSFGSSNNNQQQQQPTAATGMFSFGGNTNSHSNNAASSNMSSFIGSASQIRAQNQQNVSASFTFKPTSTSNSAPSVFSHAPHNVLAAPPPAYHQFENNQAIGNNVSASFTFGGPSGNGAQSSQPLATQSSGFNFGGPQSAPVAGGGFSFQGAQPSLTPQPSPSGGGLFNIGTGGSQQQRRPVRQATRRMK